MPQPLKLIIDTDPGIDDAMAIFYAAAAPDIDILGLTTIFGNVTIQQATRNALRLLEWVGLGDVPVAQGAAKPRVLAPFAPSHQVHGPEGFGNIPAETPRAAAIAENAAAFLTRMARAHKSKLIVCAIGPLTNIAAAIDLDPAFASNVARIVLMGGSLDAGGNITPHAEANIYHDPHAAEVVFASGANVEMVGLDVTDRITCHASDFSDLARRAPILGGKINDMSHHYLKFYASVGKVNGCSLHDPAAVIACTHAHLFTPQRVPIEVSCDPSTSGATLRASDNRPDVSVLMQTDARAVKAEFLSVMAQLA